ncbi:hypothetical protein CEE37_08550 [candidate division LCP-89 bacterium B3_LCP]|uniref:Uncharacterized protein n=1 Tax=candidate division LCP-89 bacterium B3_LCP TaxID=2012998 RepID=A0A532V075_UNCL8|nr:MAG: hypothetical protein CEE37_08550 [candidate division LCP-89 bacterium B3_LCP]
MSQWLTIILSISLLGFFISTLYINVKAGRWKTLIIHVVILGVIILILNRVFKFPQIITTMGPGQETIIIIFCYICMVIGMSAQYLYQQAQSDNDRIKIKMAPLLMPIFVSPIVFIPLLAIIQDIPMGSGALTKSRLMLYFIAFQNGFFWKEIFEKQRQRILNNSNTS